jgi:hypothetical protein
VPEAKDFLSPVKGIRSLLISESATHQFRIRALGIKRVEVSPAALDFSFQRCNGLVNYLQFGDSSVAMDLFNPFFDNFAAAFRLGEAVAGLIWRRISAFW